MILSCLNKVYNPKGSTTKKNCDKATTKQFKNWSSIFYVVPRKIVCLIFFKACSQNDICPMANLPSLIITVVNDMEPKFFVLAN